LTILVDPAQRLRGLGGAIADEMIRLVAMHGQSAIDPIRELRWGVFADNAAGLAVAAGIVSRHPETTGPVASTAPDGRQVLSFALAIGPQTGLETADVVGRSIL
jgi:hypothetical protein